MTDSRKNLADHPCFSAHAAQTHTRVHLPIAPACTIQCRYCNRKFDCVNESRPGVTSAVLSPHQALRYLDMVVGETGVPSVVGIAGPGDAFADPAATLATLVLVAKSYPDTILCVATNGLDAADYIEELAAIGVSHLTVTVNTIDPVVGAKLYSWVRFRKRVLYGIDAAACLIERQRETIRRCKLLGLAVKINTIVVPGVNDASIGETAAAMAALGADTINCMPLLPVEGSEFGALARPDHELMQMVRWLAGRHMPTVNHCGRCRADASGIIGKDDPAHTAALLAGAIATTTTVGSAGRPNIAVATREGTLVNQHLGAAESFDLYSWKNGAPLFEERRNAPAGGSGDQRWRELAGTLNDCSALLVYRAGKRPCEVLRSEGIKVFETEGVIADLLACAFTGKNIPGHAPLPCGDGCGGTGGECG
jgi:nitrogen fixation protein NifB